MSTTNETTADDGIREPALPAPRIPRPPDVIQDPAPDYRLGRGLALAGVSTLLGLTQGLGIFLVNNNLPGIQGSLGATATEAGWLTTAYFATALSATVLLTKMRLQYGLRRFAQWAIFGYLVVSAVHLVVRDLPTALAARAALGFAASPLTALSVLYMLEAVPKRFAPFGIALGFATLQFGAPLSRIVSESLLQTDAWRGIQLLDVALASASLAAIVAVQPTPPPLVKCLKLGDLGSFLLYAAGLALLCVVFTQGRVAWWTDAGWVGVCLAGGIASLALYAALELLRAQPLLDLRWVCSPAMLTLTVTVLLFRVVLSEQPIGAVTFMNTLGFNNDQMHPLFAWVTVGTAAGFGLSLLALPSMSLRALALIALVLICAAGVIDGNATSLTRPPDLYVSQTLLAIGTSMFLTSTLLLGFIPVIQDGMRNLVSFFAVFSAAQMLGNLIGSSVLGTFLIDRQKLHFADLVQHLQLSDPLVAARIAQGAAAYAPYTNDAAQRVALGTAALAQQVTRESFALAYDDLFHLVAIIAGVTLAWLSLEALRNRGRVTAAARLAAAALPAAASPPMTPTTSPSRP